MVYRDRKALNALFEKADIDGWPATWLGFMAEWAFHNEHVERIRNMIADYLSRYQGDPNDAKKGRDCSVEQFFNENAQEEEDVIEATPAVTEQKYIKRFLQ